MNETNLSNPLKDETVSVMVRSVMTFKMGDLVWLGCTVHRGMFPSERSIRIELASPKRKIISGFVPKEFVKGSTLHARGQVAVVVTAKPKNGTVSVLFPGEILTSTNPVEIATSLLSRQGQ